MRQSGFEFGFDPAACAACGGGCCTGERGYIWIDEAEIEALAAFLGEPVATVRGCYLRQERTGYSIKEREGESGWACWFFDETTKGCRIYSARPTQCRTFPFWDIFQTDAAGVKSACPGVVA